MGAFLALDEYSALGEEMNMDKSTELMLAMSRDLTTLGEYIKARAKANEHKPDDVTKMIGVATRASMLLLGLKGTLGVSRWNLTDKEAKQIEDLRKEIAEFINSD